MTSNGLSSIAERLSAIECYRLGNTRISRSKSNDDYNSIVAGVTLWFGVILDYNSMFCTADKQASIRGRVCSFTRGDALLREDFLMNLLTMLDGLGDILLKNISHDHGFKVHDFLMELRTWSVIEFMHPLKGCILDIIRTGFAGIRDGDEVEIVRAVREISCFLKKLDVSRPDLEQDMFNEFFSFEQLLEHQTLLAHSSIDYLRDVTEMQQLLFRHLDGFTMSPFSPGHGPGAVSQPSVKCWYDKHRTACTDGRVGYLLSHARLGSQIDYLPLVKEESSSRTSRYICVPKSWKKLRGISAEPSELQFWQQGVLRRLDAMFRHDKWWASRIDLHDQTRSRELASSASIDGKLATVDLSAASDSVTLQLVRDIFGNSHLGRWLLGTRSVFTECEGTTIRIRKFAPMGSACCFPVECMIFCLAAEVAVRRTHNPSCLTRQVCVFGDDIIIPSYATTELFSILGHLGFSVNTEKSFWTGDFREACGIEAWKGQDISPCRFRKWHSGLFGLNSTHEEISSLVSFSNELFERGLHDTRAYLLSVLLEKRVQIKRYARVRVSDTIFSTFTGECQSLASPYPTNFNLRKKFSHSLQLMLYKRIVWRERPNQHGKASENSEGYDMCEYVAWLVSHQADLIDYDRLWKDGWIESRVKNPYSRLPIGVMMVPTAMWVILPCDDYIHG